MASINRRPEKVTPKDILGIKDLIMVLYDQTTSKEYIQAGDT